MAPEASSLSGATLAGGGRLIDAEVAVHEGADDNAASFVPCQGAAHAVHPGS